MVIRIIGNDEAVLDRNSYSAESIDVVLLMYGKYRLIQLVGKDDYLFRRMTRAFSLKSESRGIPKRREE
jgi:hypothetical protein